MFLYIDTLYQKHATFHSRFCYRNSTFLIEVLKGYIALVLIIRYKTLKLVVGLE